MKKHDSAHHSMIRALIERIKTLPVPGEGVTFMEVCGTHTMEIARAGLKKMLPPHIRLTSGPGCPVCVTPISYVDKAIALCREKNCVVTTFGDMFRVPGTASCLERERARGADIRIVYSPIESARVARDNPGKRVVFLSVGFETTTPGIAATILHAGDAEIRNLFFLCANKTVPHAMDALLAGGKAALDGFLCPGHVSAITGSLPYRAIAARHNVPCVVAGFEPIDVVRAIAMLLVQTAEGRHDVEIEYDRVVRPEGNRKARDIAERVFEPADAEWRGIGTIPGSGLRLRGSFACVDAEQVFDLSHVVSREPRGCRCGEILAGAILPPACRLFGKKCTPEHPVGACMVSSEGTCAAYYTYEQ
ncbi:MAG TPA: hydrogenase formation protein HypD [bacterium]|nr:hydrogenase formation protein HypD [bacterium]